MKNPKGFPLKKGQIIRINGDVEEVAEDVDWNDDFQTWGSVWLVNKYPPVFTHKSDIEILIDKPHKKD